MPGNWCCITAEVPQVTLASPLGEELPVITVPALTSIRLRGIDEHGFVLISLEDDLQT